MDVRVEVAWGEGVKVVSSLPELPGLVLVGIELGIPRGVSECLAKPRIVK